MDFVVRSLEILVLLGLVIFVHELGHFLVARWAGVLVERFSIGFGPVLLSIRRGETEYALSAIPLGGYVKMLGQTDTPEVEEDIDDERSYQNKSVGARMAIISAGVIMNLIFGFACFALAYRIGVPYQPAIIGTVIPGQPAWKAGLRPGDRLTAINGRRNVDYDMLLTTVALTRPPDESVEFEVDRDGTALSFAVAPAQKAKKPQIGVLSSLGLELFKKDPTHPNTPASRAADPGFKGGDKVIAVDEVPVASYAEFVDRVFEAQTKPVAVTVERFTEGNDPGETAVVRVEPNFVRHVGLRMDLGPVIAVQTGSPAASAVDAAGEPNPIQPTDLIKAIDGDENIDPIRLPDVITAKAGRPVVLTIVRRGKEQTEIDLTVVPNSQPTWIDFPNMLSLKSPQPMSIPSIGVAYGILPTVHAVAADSPAAKAAIQSGDKLTKAVFHVKQGDKIQQVSDDSIEDHLPGFFWSMQYPEIEKIDLTVERSKTPIEVILEPVADKSWPLWMRGTAFRMATADRQETTLSGALMAGVEKTRKDVTNLYLFLRGLVISLTISPKLLAGPITIATVAYDLTENFPMLILFLGMLSINLAVINFLPIPILDGGHMMFLTYELVTRRQPSERVLFVANHLGLFLILGLMIYVFGLDFIRQFTGEF